MAKTRGTGISKREAAKSESSKAKQREDRAYGPGHPFHPSKFAAAGAPPGKRMQDVAEKHKREFPKMVENIRNDRKKDFKKVKPKPSARSRTKKAGGGMTTKGLGRAFMKGGKV